MALPGEGYRCHERLLAETAACGAHLSDVFQMSELFQLYEFAASGQGLGFCVMHLAKMSAFGNPDVKVVYMPSTIWGFDIVRLRNHAMTDAERTLWNYTEKYCTRLPGNVLDRLDDPYALTAAREFTADELERVLGRPRPRVDG